jgi:hypothetical protein
MILVAHGLAIVMDSRLLGNDVARR